MSEKDTHEPEQNVTQPTRRTKKKKRGKAGRIVRKTVRTVVVLAVIVGAGLFGLKAYIQKQAESSDSESYSRAVVTRGAMEETVYGTGTTSARNQTNVLAGADGTLTDLRVSVGDEVKAGDILAVLTNADLDDEITDLEFDLWELDDTILDTGVGSKVTAVEAPAAGRVMAIYAGVGDDALAVFRREGALAIISTDGRMKVELSDVDASAGVALNDKLTVTRARKLQKFLSQPFAVAENFTGLKGKYVPLKDTVRSFAAIVDGKADDLPEWAFFNVGTLEEAREKAEKKLAEEKGGAV